MHLAGVAAVFQQYRLDFRMALEYPYELRSAVSPETDYPDRDGHWYIYSLS
jgi:hypothetical protein